MCALDVQQCSAPGLQEQYSPPAMTAHVLGGECWICGTAENVRVCYGDVLVVHNTLDPVLFEGVRFTAHASQIFWACAISMRLPGKIYLTEQFLNVTHAPC